MIGSRNYTKFIPSLFFLLLYYSTSAQLKKDSIDNRIVNNNNSFFNFQINNLNDTSTVKESAKILPTKSIFETLFTKDTIPLVTVFVTLSIFVISTYLKQRDDKRERRLKRLDTQLNELYGPLLAWYEIGHSNFESFRKTGNRFLFTDHNYRSWFKEVFKLTNIEMEKIIIEKAGLFEERVPSECIEFCQRVAALKKCAVDLKEIEQKYETESSRRMDEMNKDLQSLDDLISQHKHPQHLFQAYIKVAFDILKDEQNRLIYKSGFFYKVRNFIFLNYKRAQFLIENGSFYKPMSLYERIDKEKILKSEILQQVNESREHLSRLPFEPETHYRDYFNSKNSIKKIKSLKVSLYKFRFGSANEKTDLMSIETISYDMNGKPLYSKTRNANKNDTSYITYNVISKTSDEYSIYGSDKKDPIGKAIIKYCETHKNNKTELQYYEKDDMLDYKIKYTLDKIGKVIAWEKLDNRGNTVENILPFDDTNYNESYKWITGNNSMPDWERKFKIIDDRNNAISTKRRVTIERKDIIQKSGKIFETRYEYEFGDKGEDEEGYVVKMTRYRSNKEPDFYQKIEYEFYETSEVTSAQALISTNVTSLTNNPIA